MKNPQCRDLFEKTQSQQYRCSWEMFHENNVDGYIWYSIFEKKYENFYDDRNCCQIFRGVNEVPMGLFEFGFRIFISVIIISELAFEKLGFKRGYSESKSFFSNKIAYIISFIEGSDMDTCGPTKRGSFLYIFWYIVRTFPKWVILFLFHIEKLCDLKTYRNER